MPAMLWAPVSVIATRISLRNQVEQLGDARLASRGHCIQPGAAEQHALGAQGQHPDDIQSRPNTRVGQHGGSIPHRIDNGRQRSRARQDAIELPTAMI